MTDLALLIAEMFGVSAAAFLVARSPAFWFGIFKLGFSALMPKVWRIIRPKNFTKEQLEKIARGQDPFSERR